MSLSALAGRLLSLEDAQSVGEVKPSFAAPWAHDSPAWVFFGCLALFLAAVLFYLKAQKRLRPGARFTLLALRAAVLCVILVALAEPVLTIQLVSSPKPLLWLLFDGTDSMAIEDDLPEAERMRLERAVGVDAGEIPASQATPTKSRMAWVKALLERKDGGLLGRLAEKVRLRAFLFDRPDGVRALDWTPAGPGDVEGDALARQLTTSGQVTALGAALEDLARHQVSTSLAAVMVFSDFGQNSGPPPLAAARKLGVPVYSAGVGRTAALDLAVDLQAPLLMKKAERSPINVTLRQTGLDGVSATVKVTASALGANAGGADAIVIGEKTVALKNASVPVEIPWEPAETGRFVLHAEAQPLEGEVVRENNHAEREVSVRDDFLRVLFVEYEPTWEWRFIKEVFHRDRLVGMRGFRTFLRSADPKVRQSNELFLPTLTPPRSEFFANDVIFLGDVPASALGTRFCEMTRELVSKFGGGLIVLAGPRFGPGQLASTPLADMLPVIVDPAARLREGKEFRLQLTPEALATDFMRLGANDAESARAWDNLGPLPWYQPVARLHPLAAALAQHPDDTCVDGRTPQPLIAIRRYGAGEVIYIAFNETWRLRRKYGELYYRQLWGQMIHRLGLSHALGTRKRFVVRTDRQQYQADDKAIVTVEAYDASFDPLTEDKLPGKKLSAELVSPARPPDGGESAHVIGIPQLREGVFEAQIPLFESGEHHLRVKDPISGEEVEIVFQVTSISVERKSAVRNAALERELAASTGGKTYDLETVASFPDDLRLSQRTESEVRVFPLWNTWLTFGSVVLLLLLEWGLRKAVSLP